MEKRNKPKFCVVANFDSLYNTVMPYRSFDLIDYSCVLQEKSNNSGGEFTLDIYVKEKNDNPCRPKVIYSVNMINMGFLLTLSVQLKTDR